MFHESFDYTPGIRSAETSIFCNLSVLTAMKGRKLDWEGLRPNEYYKTRALDRDGNEVNYLDLMDGDNRFQAVHEWQISRIHWEGQGTPLRITKHFFLNLERGADVIELVDTETSLPAVETDSHTNRRRVSLDDYDDLYELLESVRGLELKSDQDSLLWGELTDDERQWERELG